ncbi:MAG: TonB-dependent receptor, partial [Candidatus Calescibacterium sp.]|nr:TonB-dependent receptor [Candidatus Calescibacterium sp.]MDW8132507.1 TonB-dependent receptor [Candidatus Calescibacterium sp.]
IYQKSDKQFFRFSVSYSNVRILNTVPNVLEYLPNSPKLLILAKYGCKLGNNFSAGLELKYTSRTLPDNYKILSVIGDSWARRVDRGIFEIPRSIKPFLLANLTLKYYFDDKNYMTLYIYNLFNEKYYYPISLINSRPIYSYPGFRRSIYLGINYTF